MTPNQRTMSGSRVASGPMTIVDAAAPVHAAARWAALVLVFACVVHLLAPDLAGHALAAHRVPQSLLVAMGAVLGAAICAAFAWTSSFAINASVPSRPTFVSRRGLWPLTRAVSGDASDLRCVTLLIDGNGHLEVGDRRAVAWVETRVGRIRIGTAQTADDGRKIAEQVAHKLGVPFEMRVLPARPPNRAARAAVAIVAWAGLAATLAVMLRPMLTQQRSRRAGPIQVVRASLGAPDFDKGTALYDSQRYADAETQFRAFVKRVPRNAMGYNMLAYALVQQGKRAEALAVAKRALALAPADGEIIDTVGEMYERSGHPEPAVRFYKLALQRLPVDNSDETHTKLGRTLMAMGRFDEAEQELNLVVLTRSGQWAYMAMYLRDELRMQREMRARMPHSPASSRQLPAGRRQPSAGGVP